VSGSSTESLMEQADPVGQLAAGWAQLSTLHTQAEAMG